MPRRMYGKKLSWSTFLLVQCLYLYGADTLEFFRTLHIDLISS